ncbi:unnamed protein product [Adineta steineri]|uniref:UDP-sugar transporter protein SLC35A4 n=1 Tax=Adineta steineri TaxID=433720 RepID=A0A814Q1M7_9BILA|nr:unnamed protein product [Adineta steineri]
MADSSNNIDKKKSILSTVNDSTDIKRNNDKALYSLAFRGMILFQIIAYGSYSVLVHLCEKNGVITFSSTTMNFILEVVKLSFSFMALMFSSSTIENIHPSKEQFISWFKQSLPYSIPGVLYFINNNLAVHMQLYMDPASYQILGNFKILTTAIMYRLIIKQNLKRKQWFALFLLFSGGVAYSLGTIRNSSSVSKQATTSSAVMNRMYVHPLGFFMITSYCIISGFSGVYNEWILKKYYTESIHIQNIFLYTYGVIFNLIPAITVATYLPGRTIKNSSGNPKQIAASGAVMNRMYVHPLGFFMITSYCIISGFSGVYNEWILKKYYTESIHIQNIFLYTYGVIFNLIPAITVAMYSSGSSYSFNLFHGFTFYTWIIIITQALSGIFMGVIIKHSSNIIRLFVISFSLIVTAVLSVFIFNIHLNIYFFITFVTMMCALSIYYS